jgi:thiamine pyrophosphokinase
VKPGIRSRLTGKPGDVVSLIPLFGNVEGITTLGLEYPLNDESLAFGATRGVSNVLVQEQAEVNIRQGLILCVINRVA